MKHAERTVAVSFIALSIYVTERALNLGLYSSIGPGAGFFPFFLGLIFGGLTLVWLVSGLWRRDPNAPTFFPSGLAGLRVSAILAAVVFWGATAEWLGFTISTFITLIFLLVVLGKCRWKLVISLAALGSLGPLYLFDYWLKVSLPKSAFGFIRALGV